jgi:hypothetical protein
MKKFIAAFAIAAALPLSDAAFAQDLPDWPLSETCNPAEFNCAKFETFARGQASGIWGTVPPKVREQCIGEVGALQPSYRLLYDCLANKMQELMRGQTQRS